MSYFDDLTFIDGRVMPHCQVRMDQRFTDTYSLELMTAGAIYLAVDGGRRTVLDRPVAFWHHPDHRYQYGPATAAGWWHHHWVTFSGARARRLVEEGLDPLAANPWLPVSQPAPLAALFRALSDLAHRHDPSLRGQGVVLLERILLALTEEAAAVGPSPGRAACAALAEAVRSDPGRAWDFAAEAGRLGLSHSHFRRLFRRTASRAPYDFLLLCRMQAVARALSTDPRPVHVVAAAHGFDDPAHFSRLFSRQIGVPPGRFRALMPQAFPS